MKIDLFPIEIHHVKIGNNEELKEKYLSQIIDAYENKKYDASKAKWHTKNVHTSFGDDDQIIKEIPEVYSRVFDSIMPFPWEGKFKMWHNVYKKFEYQEVHHHVPADFSAIHFLSFDKKEHVSPIFLDPARLAKDKLSLFKIVGATTVTIPVEEGSMLIFPSYLEHLVPASEKEYKKHRVTISINLSLTKIDDGNNYI